jgi:dipeptidyl aminopeptidase/acylaminoacyl peptidase
MFWSTISEPSRKMKNIILLTCVLTLMNFSATATNGQDGQGDGPGKNQQPLTVAEKSNFTSTSRSAEVVEFVETCAAKADHVTKFVYGKTVEDRPMVGAIVATKAYEIGDQDDRNVVLLLGNIHSGECAGKEALLQLLRELTYNPGHPWLEKNVILFAPNYNADANDRMGKNNRPGQVGPINGMGQRQNAQQLDLNRDFCKLESPEARALVTLIDKTNPHLFVDCHTTNGSKHQYGLTYDIPHNPATSKLVRSFLRQKMMPVVTKELEKKDQLTFYYGNFNKEHTAWTTFGHEPRYSTEYVGLRGRLGILSEAYSYLDYKGRIVATYDFVSELLNYVTENRDEVQKVIQTAEQEFIDTAKADPARVEIPLSAKVTKFDDKFTLKGFKDDQPHDYQCDFVGKYEPVTTTPLPYAYLIPQKQARIVDRLLIHGVSVEQLKNETKIDVEIDTVKNLAFAERAFQRHKMLRIESDRSTGNQEIAAGTYVVKTAQPLGRFVCYMLESQSDDGFAFWNFLDADLEKGKAYPILRVAKTTELETTEVDKVKKTTQLSFDLIDGPHSLLTNTPRRPRWFGNTNWIKTEYYGREILMDAETGGFVSQPARPYVQANVKKAIIDAGIEESLAEDISSADPTVATNNSVAIFSAKGHAVVYFTEGNPDVKTAIEIIGQPKNKAELFRFNDDESKIAFTTPAGLHFFDIASRKTNSVMAEDDQHLIGKLDWVYQEELYGRGNFKGYWWQKGGNQVAFLKLDESPLFPFTVMDHLPVRGESESTNYPKAGDPNPIVSLGVANSNEQGKVTWVNLEKYAGDDILITGVSWSADGTQLLAQIQNREQTWLDLVATDADGGNVKVLFRDQTPAWIESPGDPVLLEEGRFLWRSPRTGYSHLYQYDANGELLGAVTSGDWEVRSLIGVDPTKKQCYFTATKDNPREVQCYAVEIATGEITALTDSSGDHSVSFSKDYSYFIDSHSTVNEPATHFLRTGSGEMVRRLHVNSDDRLSYLDISEPEFVTVAGDGQPMDGMLIKPPNFDPTKKYPVLVHIYAGPQAPRVRNRFGGTWYLWHQMLAQQGYVIWMCDNQSASYRSAKHVWPVHKNFAANELADIETGVEWLKTNSWVDADRIGIWGWSYGGYMTAYAMTRSETFKMGISGAPVTDWKNYDSIYTERYMGTPQNNPEGYKASSILNNNAKNLHGELLLIHGTIDDNVHFNNTIQFVKELQDAGKQFELMVYPGNRHSVTDKKQAAHLRKMMTKFIKENL